MNLIVDIGNSYVKVAVMDGEQIITTQKAEHLDDITIDELVEKYKISRSIVCSTRANGEWAAEYIEEKTGHCLHFNADVETPLRNEYATPKTLGRDRLAAAVGAHELYGKNDLLIVDFGTAITFDYVTADGSFKGGFISPGIDCRFRALHDYTATLPLCSASHETIDVATTTRDAIVHGVMNSILFEIEGYIRLFSEKSCNLSIIFSGGDAIFFDKRIKNTIFANQELIFRGLNRILKYNAEI